MNLETEYLGIPLPHPLIAGASPLPDDLDKVRRLEDAGVAAITMYSLFEEQITHNMVGAEAHLTSHEESFSEAVSYFPEVDLLERDVDLYLNQLRRVGEAVNIPVIASLNGNREGSWVRFGSLMEEAGADALELNLYNLATDPAESAHALEERCLRVVEAVRAAVRIPLSVKLSPFFTALPHFAKRLEASGADGLVLFNRFYQPEFDVETLEVRPSLHLSHSNELPMRLRWIGLLYGLLDCDLSVTGGAHTGLDVCKGIMAGASSVQMVSGLLINGPEYISEVLEEFRRWMEELEYPDLSTMRGCLSFQHCADPEALERANYMRLLRSWKPRP